MARFDVAYQTACGYMFQVIEGSPEDNLMRYCPFCGWELVSTTIVYVDDPSEEEATL
jgi:hypothetical protein